MGYTAVFAGLGSAFSPRYTKGTKAIAARIPGSTHHASGSGYADWPRVADEIIDLHNAGILHRPLSLIGHSNGVYAILKIAKELATKGVMVDYLASIDKTLKPCPDAGGNIRVVHDFWAGLSKVKFSENFMGKKEFFNLDKIADGVGHVEAATLPFTQDKIVATIAQLSKGETEVTNKFYMGEGRRLSEEDFTVLSASHNIPEYLLRAVVQVEAGQKGSHSSGALVFRYELHKAFQYSSGEIRKRLINEGLAHSDYNTALNWSHANSYPHLEKAATIAGEELACLASSWGMGQIMGFNHRVLGFETALEMVTNFAVSEANQINGMVAFIKGNGLLDDLLAENWKAFAAGYNGSKYASNEYDIKLENAAKEWRALIGGGVAIVDPHTPQQPTNPAKPPAIDAVGDLDDIRDVVAQYFPKLTEQNVELVLALAMILGRVPSPDVNPVIQETKSIPAITPDIITPQSEKGNGMKDTKGFFKSTTIQGIIAALFGTFLPAIAPTIGLDFTPEDGGQIIEGFSKILQVGGLIFGMIGRLRANTTIKGF